MLKKEIAVQLMKHLVEHDWHGYSQYSRWGDGEGTCDIEIGGKIYKLEQGDRDCSSAIISAFEAAGISCGGATYTGNMRKLMVATGNFVWHPMSSGYIAKAGDVYLNEACHTAMCLSAVPDMLMEFSSSETGGIDGAEGDQTGNESHIRAYYDYPWDGILECINKEEVTVAATKATPKQIPGNPVNNIGLYYQAHCQTVGWLDPVHDGQTAGTTNYAKRMEALKILMDKLRKAFPDIEIDVKAHIQKKGWVLYKNITSNTVIGSVRESLRLEALEFIVRGLPAGKKLMYRVHVQGKGWIGWVEAGFATGSVGFGVRIEAIQIVIVDE